MELYYHSYYNKHDLIDSVELSWHMCLYFFYFNEMIEQHNVKCIGACYEIRRKRNICK